MDKVELDWAGKKTRDVVMMIFVSLQAVVAGLGLWMFVLWKGATGKRPVVKKEAPVPSLSPSPLPSGTTSTMSQVESNS